MVMYIIYFNVKLEMFKISYEHANMVNANNKTKAVNLEFKNFTMRMFK